MSALRVRVPADLERRDIVERLRWWAAIFQPFNVAGRTVSAALEEAATEIELGRTTRLTYVGED